MNSPYVSAYAEVRKLLTDDPIALLSLGTNEPTLPVHYEGEYN